MGFFDRVKKINLFSGFSELTDEFYDQLEESMILADAGAELAVDLVEQLRAQVRAEHIKTMEDARACMCRLLCQTLGGEPEGLDLSTSPSVVLLIGVNGVGKTTTIGKLGAKLMAQGKRVLFCAGDTFRAAAGEQLELWAKRVGGEIIRQHEGSDPAAVLFDAIAAARARKSDVILVDTAGRLHNKENLMRELNKLSRVIDRELPGAARETLLVLDATTGQNGLFQARAFQEAAGITGIVLTKLDGTAKGGIALAIAKELQVPVKYAGVGEGVDDLQPFDPMAFAQALI